MKDIPEKLSILIPDGTEYHSWNVAMSLANVPNLKLHVLSKTRWPLVRFSRHRASFHYVKNRGNDDARIETISQIVRQNDIDVILPITEPGIRFVSVHRKQLEKIAAIAPTPDPDTFDLTVDKGLFATFLAQKGLPHPHTIPWNNEGSPSQQISDIPFPALVKPTKGAGGEDMHLFEKPDSALKFFRKKSSSSKRYIIQEYIPGHDMGCSLLCLDGKILAYTIQDVEIPNPRAFDNWWGIRFVQNDEVLDTVTKLMHELNFSGVAHIDLRYNEQEKQVEILELNPRFWASLLGSHCAGVNFPYWASLAGLGISFPVPDYSTESFIIVRPLIKQLKTMILGPGKSYTAPVYRGTSWPYYLNDPLPFLVNHLRRR